MTIDSLFDHWERAWSGRDPAAFEAVCDPDVRYEDPLTAEPLAGAGAIGGHAQRLWRAFPDARINSTGDRLTDGVHACAPCKVLGTHRMTGRFVVVHAVVYAELRDGRMRFVRAFFDVYGSAVTLGLLPRSGSAGERALLLLRGFGLRA